MTAILLAVATELFLSRHISETTTYYRSRKESRIWSVEWRHFNDLEWLQTAENVSYFNYSFEPN